MSSLYKKLHLDYEYQIRIGQYAAIASIVVVLLMPMWKCLWIGSSFVRILGESEQFGMLLFFIIVSWLIHTPLLASLFVFRIGICHLRKKLAIDAYVVVSILFTLSAMYYYHHTAVPKEYRWLRYLPALVDFILLLLLSVGLYGSIKRNTQIWNR